MAVCMKIHGLQVSESLMGSGRKLEGKPDGKIELFVSNISSLESCAAVHFQTLIFFVMLMMGTPCSAAFREMMVAKPA